MRAQLGRRAPRSAAWLKERQVDAVAMESTGVYWIPLHAILEREGFEVLLVDTRQLARVPGRNKSDRNDCECGGEKQFVSHLTLAPYKPISGGKTLKRKKKPHSARSRVAAALRMAAVSLAHSQSALGAYCRRIAQRKGADVAIFATARKLAQHIYRMLRWGKPWVDEGVAAYERRFQEARLARLKANAKNLGLPLVPDPSPT